MIEISETEIKSMTKEQNYMRGYEDGKSDVLEQIRAEIEQVADEEEGQDEKWAIGLRYAVKIIDNYTKGDKHE